MVKNYSKKIIKNSLFKTQKRVLISYKVVLNYIYIFYLGNISNNFILFHLDLRNLKTKIRLKYRKFLIFSMLFRIFQRIGFLSFLSKSSNNFMFVKKIKD